MNKNNNTTYQVNSYETLPCLSWHYYIPLYCLFISLMLFATRNLAAAKAAPIGLSNINRVICIPLAIAYTSIFLLTQKGIRKPSLPLKLFFVYILIGALSTWLFSDWFLYSVWKLLEMLAVFMTVFYAWDLERKYPGILIVFYKKTILFYKFLLISVVASVVLVPGKAIQLASSVSDAILPYRVSGPLLNVNAISVGTISAFVIYILTVKFIYNKRSFSKADSFWIIISLLLLVFAQSRTAIAGLLLALAVLMVMNKKSSLLVKASILFTGVMAVYFFSGEISSYLQRGQSTQALYSVTGRYTWWSFAYNKMLNTDLLHQLFGYGFAIGDRIMALMSSGNRMQTLDSTYMSSLVSTGFLGTTLLVFVVFYTIIKLLKKAKTNIFHLELLGLNIIIIVKSITTTTFNIFTTYTLLFVLICVLVNDKKSNRYIK